MDDHHVFAGVIVGGPGSAPGLFDFGNLQRVSVENDHSSPKQADGNLQACAREVPSVMIGLNTKFENATYMVKERV